MRWFVLAAALLSAGCGYHVTGRADMLPATIKTIAVPPFGNLTTRYRLTERIPAAITREFISRTRYAVVADPDQADAVLRGAVINYSAYPNVVDQQSGRAAGVQVTASIQVSLEERSSGKRLLDRPNMEFRQRYEISATCADAPGVRCDERQYFEESETAVERLSRDIARDVVSAVLEAF